MMKLTRRRERTLKSGLRFLILAFLLPAFLLGASGCGQTVGDEDEAEIAGEESAETSEASDGSGGSDGEASDAGSSAASGTDGNAGSSAISEVDEDAEPSEVERMLETMTLREKVGQLFIVRPESPLQAVKQAKSSDASAQGETAMSEALKEALAQYPVGGIVHFSKNIVSPEQISAFNRELQENSAIPLFIAVDEEGGAVSRLANSEAFDLPRYKSASDVGKSGDSLQAFKMGRDIGAYLHEYGFTMDFAPVADVNTNPDNPIIGERAFSGDAKIAADMAKAMADGLREEGVTAVYKHFPGHGDTQEDSHKGIAVSRRTKEEMQSLEWLPFLNAGSCDGIMIGHITTPNLTQDPYPASLSYEVVSGILREEMEFDGLIITDSLEMGAVTEEYGNAEAAVLALQAGCDILLMPENLREAFDAVMAAVEDGTISEERLNESVERILRFKGLAD